MDLFEQVITAVGFKSRAYLGKAEVLREFSRFQESLPVYETYLAHNKQDKVAWNNYGLALDGLKRTDEARLAYEKALAVDSEYTPALINLATCFKEAGEIEQALSLTQKAIALEPGEEAFYNLACYQALLGELCVAKEPKKLPDTVWECDGPLEMGAGLAASCDEKTCPGCRKAGGLEYRSSYRTSDYEHDVPWLVHANEYLCKACGNYIFYNQCQRVFYRSDYYGLRDYL